MGSENVMENGKGDRWSRMWRWPSATGPATTPILSNLDVLVTTDAGN